MVRGTRFEGHVNTSTPLKRDALNILALPAAQAGLPELECNCAYLGSQLIVCDSQFLRSFANSINYDVADPALKEILDKVQVDQRKWLTSWLIGHEIGHAVLHDREGRFGARLSNRRGVTETLEHEADAFFAERVPTGDRDRATFVLNNFAFSAISLTYEVPASGSGASVIAPSRDGIHPPWLLRAISVARTISELKAGTEKSSDFYESILSHIKVDARGADVGTLCSAQNLRSLAAQRTRLRQSR